MTDMPATPHHERPLKRAASTRAGFDYQDLMGVQVLLDFYQGPDLYEWVRLESDGAADKIDPGFLDDIVAKRKSDGLVLVKQVKFCVRPTDKKYSLSFKWLLEKTGERGTSMLFKWCKTTTELLEKEQLGEACLLTNRIPDQEISDAFDGNTLNPGRLSVERWKTICDELGGEQTARAFFANFDFLHSQPTLPELAQNLRDRIVPSYTDGSGWLYLLEEVRTWAMYKNFPTPGGNITYNDLTRVITTKRPKPISQEFEVPEGYAPPDEDFDHDFLERLNEPGLIVLSGTPGRGKSTYLSSVVERQRKNKRAVIRHHYFLSLKDTANDRVSFVSAADSLISQLQQQCPEAMQRYPNPPTDDLRELLEHCGDWCKGEGYPLAVVIDGLDHVWRERDAFGGEQMEHLFAMLLPLPENVALVLGTQPVANELLPSRLVSHARESDWIDIPPMSVGTIRSWIEIQLEGERLLPAEWANSEEHRDRWLNEVAEAFHNVTSGHPLHFIYSLESLIRNGRPVREDDVQALPACPDGDIRNYYGALWADLPEASRELLHLFAAAGFHWPQNGMYECIGGDASYFEAWSKIGHMLDIRSTAVLPFHGSILVYIQERPDHAEAASRLLPKIEEWLTDIAPLYWRWAWLWITKAKNGDVDPLLNGPSREWVIEALCQGYPISQIANILTGSEQAALDAETYPRLVELRALEIRLLNGVDFQTHQFDDFQECALSLSDDSTALDLKLDNLSELEGDELIGALRLAAKTHPELPDKTLEIANRQLRHEHEFGDTHTDLTSKYETVLRTVAYIDLSDPDRLIRFCKEAGSSSHRLFANYIQELLRASKIERVFELWNASELPQQFALTLANTSVRVACLERVRIDKRSDARKALASPLGAIWERLIAKANGEPQAFNLPDFSTKRGDYYEDQGNLYALVHGHFFTALDLYLGAEYDFDIVPPRMPERSGDWLPDAMTWLGEQANRVADEIQAGGTIDITTLCLGIGDLGPVGHSHDDHMSSHQFARALGTISTDLHLLSMANGNIGAVSLEQIEAVCGVELWNNVTWVAEFLERDPAMLSPKASLHLVSLGKAQIEDYITEFGERTGELIDLAQFATRQGVDDEARALLCSAAGCILGYGNRKDPSAHEVIEAVEACIDANVGDIQSWLTKLSPAAMAITDYTDGKGTNRIPGMFTKLLAKVKPEWLPHQYRKQVEAEEWYAADNTLIEAVKVMDLSNPEAQALVKTMENEECLIALHERAEAGDAHAEQLVAEHKRVVGPALFQANEKEASPTMETDDKPAIHVELSDYPPEKLRDLTQDVRSDYSNGRITIQNWLDYWVEQGLGLEALQAVKEALDADRSYSLEYVIDHAFEVALELQGPDAAFPWIVLAHIRRSGWSRFMGGRKAVTHRLKRVAEVYPERWQEYVRAVSQPRWGDNFEGSVVTGSEMLVHFLLLLGEHQVAEDVTNMMVDVFLSELSEQPIGSAPWQTD